MAPRGLLVAVFLTSCFVASAPKPDVVDGPANGARAVAATTSAPASSPSGKPLESCSLRILPLGDSITYGLLSSTGDGYRNVVYKALARSNAVALVGSQRHGTMADNRNEGHSGYRIDQVADVANQSLAANPDAVLLHAGTNDCLQSYAPASAPARLGDLIDQVVAALPHAALLVAQIVGSPNATIQAAIDAFNAQVPAVVQQRAGAGARVAAVDMSRLLDPGADFDGDVHPNDLGYAKMGAAWVHALEAANAAGWIGNASAASVSVSQNAAVLASLPPQLTDAAAWSAAARVTAAASAISTTAATSATSTTAATSTAGAQRLAAVPMGVLFALPGLLLSMAAPTERQQF